jgi:hypothetical protein
VTHACPRCLPGPRIIRLKTVVHPSFSRKGERRHLVSCLASFLGALIDVGPTVRSEWTGSTQARECFGDQEGTNEIAWGCCDPNAPRREEQAILALRIRNGGTKSLIPFRSSGPRVPCDRRSLHARRAVGHRARTLGGRKTDTYFQLLGAYGTFFDRQKLENR